MKYISAVATNITDFKEFDFLNLIIILLLLIYSCRLRLNHSVSKTWVAHAVRVLCVPLTAWGRCCIREAAANGPRLYNGSEIFQDISTAGHLYREIFLTITMH